MKHRRNHTPLWAYPLWPLGVCFLGAARLKAWWFRGVTSPIDLGRPTVSIGNLSFGGTGKTPVTLAIARMLLEMGQRPAILMRGYGRTTRGPRLVRPGDQPCDVGDEAILLVRSLPQVPVAVGERREEAAALVSGECTVFLLDDGFQHLRVRRCMDLLLVDASCVADLHAPPVGRLREGLSATQRAHAILVTRGSAQDLPSPLSCHTGGRPVVGVLFPWTAGPVGRSEIATWDTLIGKPLAAFAGIGHPEAFFGQARSHGLTLASCRVFPDHAIPDPVRLALVLEDAKHCGARAILTTEKDAIKWEPVWPPEAPPLLYPRLSVEFDGNVAEMRALLARACSARSD